MARLAKNITLSMPADISEQMEKFMEVNWSAVARQAIEIYLKVRSQPEVAPIINRLVKEKGEEYANGAQKALKLAKSLPYKELDLLFKDYQKQVDDATDTEVQEQLDLGAEPSELAGMSISDKEQYQIFEKVLRQRGHLNMNEECSTEFIHGLHDTLREILQKL